MRRGSDTPVLPWGRRSSLWVGEVGLPLGVIGAPHQRPRLHVAKTERPADGGQLGKLVGMIVLLDREVARGGTQVLAEGQDRDVDLAQVAERRDQLVPRLTEPEDDSRLRRQARRRRARVAEDRE